MVNDQAADKSKKVKNIAAVVYLLLLVFLVGGSYLHQQSNASDDVSDKTDPVFYPQP